jgi:acyl carrier protein
VQREFMQDLPEFELTDDTDLIAESIVDSLGLFVLISFLEESYGVTVEPDEVTFENFKSVRTIAELVRSKQAVKASA